MSIDLEVQEKWDSFWAPICAPNGVLDLDQVKRELFDFSVVMHEVSLVYDEITGGRISKPNTMAFAVLGEYHALVEELVEEAIRDIESVEGDS